MKSDSFATLFSAFAVTLRHPLPTTFTSAQLAFTLLNMTQLFSPLATSTQSDQSYVFQ